MKIYILAQGKGSRWKDDSGRDKGIQLPSEYKQLVPIGNGEVLIQRTIRQLWEISRARGIRVEGDWSHATLIAPGDFLLYNIPKWIEFRSFREPTGCILEGICKTKKEWRDHRIVFLLGDVVYSNRMMQKIISNTDTVSFFGREGANIFTGKDASKIFALSFNKVDATQLYIWHWMRKLWFRDQINDAKLWTLYNYIHETYPVQAYPMRTVDNDYTDDIDSPEEYNLFYEKLKELALADDKRRI